MRSFFAACRELLFPPSCLACGRRLDHGGPPLFCDACRASLRLIRAPRCDICGLPFPGGENHICGTCLRRPPAYARARAALAYRPPVTSLISDLKFKGCLTGLPTLIHLVRYSTGFSELSDPDLIMPVPLHPKRLRQRGFNQALLIARGCFPARRDRIDTTTLIRSRSTAAQSRLGRKKRQQNISGAFSVIQPQKVTNRIILLVDDVLTTGSTANECARTLRESGAKDVEVLVVARAIDPADKI